MANKCIHAAMEFLLVKEIAVSSNEHRPPKLTTKLEEHLNACERCRRLYPDWVKKMAEASQEDQNH